MCRGCLRTSRPPRPHGESSLEPERCAFGAFVLPKAAQRLGLPSETQWSATGHKSSFMCHGWTVSAFAATHQDRPSSIVNSYPWHMTPGWAVIEGTTSMLVEGRGHAPDYQDKGGPWNCASRRPGTGRDIRSCGHQGQRTELTASCTWRRYEADARRGSQRPARCAALGIEYTGRRAVNSEEFGRVMMCLPCTPRHTTHRGGCPASIMVRSRAGTAAPPLRCGGALVSSHVRSWYE